jgi:hypothetical protein
VEGGAPQLLEADIVLRPQQLRRLRCPVCNRDIVELIQDLESHIEVHHIAKILSSPAQAYLDQRQHDFFLEHQKPSAGLSEDGAQ